MIMIENVSISRTTWSHHVFKDINQIGNISLFCSHEYTWYICAAFGEHKLTRRNLV